MNINMTHALELAEYARDCAFELLDDAAAALAPSTIPNPDEYDTSTARAISADQLESAAFANSILDSLFDDFLPMMLIFAMIESYISIICECDIDDICADY